MVKSPPHRIASQARPRPWAKRQDVRRAFVFCGGAALAEQEILLATNAGGGIQPNCGRRRHSVFEMTSVPFRSITARADFFSSRVSTIACLPNLVSSSVYLAQPYFGGSATGLKRRPVSSSRATYLLRNRVSTRDEPSVWVCDSVPVVKCAGFLKTQKEHTPGAQTYADKNT